MQDGYEEWNAFKRDFEASIADKGYTMSDMFDAPWLADIREVYERKKLELQQKYPA